MKLQARGPSARLFVFLSRRGCKRQSAENSRIEYVDSSVQYYSFVKNISPRSVAYKKPNEQRERWASRFSKIRVSRRR